jgi:hypothetical protein
MALAEFIVGPGQWRLDLLEMLELHVSVGQRAWMMEQNRKYWAQREQRRTPEARRAKAESRERTKSFVKGLTKTQGPLYRRAQVLLQQVKELVGDDADKIDVEQIGALITACSQAAAAELDAEAASTRKAVRDERKASEALSGAAPAKSMSAKRETVFATGSKSAASGDELMQDSAQAATGSASLSGIKRTRRTSVKPQGDTASATEFKL